MAGWDEPARAVALLRDMIGRRGSGDFAMAESYWTGDQNNGALGDPSLAEATCRTITAVEQLSVARFLGSFFIQKCHTGLNRVTFSRRVARMNQDCLCGTCRKGCVTNTASVCSLNLLASTVT